MSKKKKPWKAHVIDYIKSHRRCPGEFPPTGKPDDLLTEAEFLQMATAAGFHKWDSCHFVEEILGLPTTEDMKEISVDLNQRKLFETVNELKAPMQEVQQSKKLAEFQKVMRGYVDRIRFENGVLKVPPQLLKFEEYANKYFGQ